MSDLPPFLSLDDAWEPDANDSKLFVGEHERRLAVEAPTALERAARLWHWHLHWTYANGRRRGGDRRSARFRGLDQREKISFWSMAGEAARLSTRAIKLDIKLASDLGRSSIKQIWSARIAHEAANLRSLAGLEPGQRDHIISYYVANPEAKYSSALESLGLGRAVDPQNQLYHTIIGRLGSCTDDNLRRVRDAIDAELARRNARRAA